KETIVEDYRRCCFALEVPVPKAEDLISGEVLRWEPASGRIKLRYTAKTLADWGEGEGGYRFHPAAFKGEYSVTCSGLLAGGRSLRLLFDVLGDSCFLADFGGGGKEPVGYTAQRRQYYPVRILKLAHGSEQSLLPKDDLGGLQDGPFAVTL